MKSFVRKITMLAVLVGSLGVLSPAFAGEAQDLVQARRNEVAQLLKDKASSERDKKVAAILGGLFDYDFIAKSSLGKHWDGLNEQQREEFGQVLRQLIQRNIEKNIKTTLSYEVQFVGEESDGDRVTVKTKASSKEKASEEPLQIDYAMHKVDGGFRSVDVVTEGSSMVGSYRNQFGRIIAKDGFDVLMKKMRDKLAKEK